MFDPFEDYKEAGYLRNSQGEKDLSLVKHIEHELYVRKLPESLDYVNSIKGQFLYEDFLKVHNIIFSEFYPWAGQDRGLTTPNMAISKGDTLFALPNDIQLAVSEGLRLGQTKKGITDNPGEVMGLFAYGHPFLDGNGRTMLIIHSALCNRAGFSIDWNNANKNDYLNALSNEIYNPGKGVLDNYLLPFKTNSLSVEKLQESLLNIKGLDGLDERNHVDGQVTDKNIIRKYQEFEEKRDYKVSNKLKSDDLSD